MLTNDTTKSRSIYDDFAYTHDYLQDIIHNVANFLFWHRAMLVMYEAALHQYCRFNGTLPYWDWRIDSQAPETAPVFGPTALGGDGTPDWPNCVTTGAFNKSTVLIGHEEPICLNRGFDLTDPEGDMMGPEYSPEAIAVIMAINTTYNDFNNGISDPHAVVHNSIGGDMSAPGPSPDDPIFYLHHGMVDKLWADWQNLPTNPAGGSYNGPNNADRGDIMDAKFTDILPFKTDLLGVSILPHSPSGIHRVLQVKDALWTTGGGWFCYKYSPGPLVPSAASVPVPGGSSGSGSAGPTTSPGKNGPLKQSPTSGFKQLAGTSISASELDAAGFLISECPGKDFVPGELGSPCPHGLVKNGITRRRAQRWNSGGKRRDVGGEEGLGGEENSEDSLFIGTTTTTTQSSNPSKVTAPTIKDRKNKFNLRVPKPLDGKWLSKHSFNVAKIREIENKMSIVTQYVNQINGYVSRAAPARLELAGKASHSWPSMTEEQAANVLKIEMMVANEALRKAGLA
ncbi:hypothetical protein HDU76_013316 [Blyttiomyces sp. JEL0837]|nr:hypothetical protein HDU76_013316 [Blyttiomyces sp. JEL0837]